MKSNCPVCYEDYSENRNTPKAFPHCCHSICLSCLEDMFKENNAVFCPFKCNPEGIPVYKEPGDLTTNKCLIDLHMGKAGYNLCGNCKYPYFPKLRTSMMLKFCGHSICNLCVKNISNPIKNTDYMICPFDGISKYSNDGQSLYVSNRDLNSFVEDSEIRMRCSCDVTTGRNEKDLLYNLSLEKRHCQKCFANDQVDYFKFCSTEESHKIIGNVLQDSLQYENLFEGFSKLKEMANFKELRTKIDRIKDKFSKSIGELMVLLDKISSEMTSLSSRIKSLLQDFKLEEKISIVDEALVLKSTFAKIDRTDVNDSLRIGLSLNQNYDILFNKFKKTITNKSQSEDAHVFKLKTDLLGTFIQCFDEFKAYNKNIKDITELLNVTLENNTKLISGISDINPRYDYSKNPFFIQTEHRREYDNKTVINIFE
jgi:hypothetical protein